MAARHHLKVISRTCTLLLSLLSPSVSCAGDGETVPQTAPQELKSPPVDLHFRTLDLHFPTMDLQARVEDVKGAVQALAMQETKTEVRIELSATQAGFSFGNVELISKLVDGKFPDYTRVIPTQHKNRMQTEREPLRQALLRAAILSNEKFRGVRWVLGEGSLKIVSSNAEQEEAHEELEVDGADAREVERLYRSSPLAEIGILAMGGHEDGIVVFGRTAEEAGQVVLRYLARAYEAECRC